MTRFKWGWLGFVAVAVSGCGGRVAEDGNGASTGVEGAACASTTACSSGASCATGRCGKPIDVNVPGGDDRTTHTMGGAAGAASTSGPTTTNSATPPNATGVEHPGAPEPTRPPDAPSTGGIGVGAGAPIANYVFAGATEDGHVVAAYWTGSSEATVLIDPATGTTTFVGTLGDLYMWQDQIVYDEARRVVYAIGQDRADARHLYSLSLDTGRSTSAPLADTGGRVIDYVVSGITSSGQLVVAYWTGAAEVTALLDPATGVATVAGTLGDLSLWQDQTVYDDRTGLVYAIGQDREGTDRLYALSLNTKESTSVVLPKVDGVMVNYVLGGLASDGRIVAAYWTSSAEAVVLIDPPKGTAAFVGNLGDLYLWQNQLVYGRAARAVYAVGQNQAGATHFYALPIEE